ncbi:MAG TPA: MFS transporter [Solirubrobacter sp.]|nr:MFS transporter [Solirubrobacter sp.]
MSDGTVETRIPARMDRLPWSGWHRLVVLGLGTVWILDGLEVTIVGAIASRLSEKDALGISEYQVAVGGTFYIAGAAVGALFFGYLTDRLGRKKLFLVSLGVYLLATVLTGFTWSAWSFWLFRFFTGFGIGGEYAAINSAIDELIPARARGWVDLAINGSYWLGAAFGAALSGLLLDKSLFDADLGWRLAFFIGAVLAVGIMLVRRHVPESPRWLMIHGRAEEAERLVSDIEREVQERTGQELREPREEIELQERESTGFIEIARTLFSRYPSRSFLGFTLLATQAFVYNAVIFTFSLVLTSVFKVDSSVAGLYLIPFGIANFLGALLLGRLFDTVGRRVMISGTYFVAALILAGLAALLAGDALGTWGYMGLLCAAFFVASAAASAGYLTVSEMFPLEIRAMAIALFYAISTGVGGAVGPLLFGKLLGGDDPTGVALGYWIAAGLMAVAAVVEIIFGVDAEQQSLEEIAEPLSAEAAT